MCIVILVACSLVISATVVIPALGRVFAIQLEPSRIVRTRWHEHSVPLRCLLLLRYARIREI